MTRTLLLGALGLVLAVALGFGVHLLTGDTVARPVVRLEEGPALAPVTTTTTVTTATTRPRQTTTDEAETETDDEDDDDSGRGRGRNRGRGGDDD